MDKPFKFALPSPNFNKNKDACKAKPHFLTPSGMSLLPREKQPPPMYGKHGATVPAKYLKQDVVNENPFVAATPPPPPPEKQYCEPCELELHSLEDLKRHRAQHEKCPVAGCLYRGHPSVMDKHINALHASGLFDKFKKLSTPEEIAAWRAERRKRYPTLANVLLKQKAQEQRQKRGERLEANKNRFGKVNDRKRAQPNTQDDKSSVDEKKPREDSKPNPKNNKKNRKNKRNQKNQETKPKVQNDVIKQIDEKKEEESEFTCCGIKMFGGTSQLKNYKHFSDKKKEVPNNALFGLLGMYGSDDDDDNEESDDNESVTENSEIHIESVKVIEEKNSNRDNRTIETTCEATESNAILETDNGNVENRCDANKETTKEDSSLAATNSDIHKEVELATTDINKSITDLNETATKDELNKNTIKNNENSSDEAPEETAIQRSMPDYPAKPSNNPKNPFSDEPAEKRTKLTDQQPTTSKQKKLVKRKSGLDYRKARLRKQNTMLEKLLETDIRHERNVLLQCIRYVCENNFFGIGQNNQEKPG
ncbi:FMR1-interacting protein NUFIP1 [Calliphora vicina]|uniref:FMR1-interacting protein NUFIP1 n=1 Tax=Calliphora vicina TaxID=7373 RepID=UPI00325B8050